MNKTLKIVLVLSLAANAVWLLGSAAGYFSIAKTHADTAASGKDAAAQALALSPQAAKEINTLLSTSDMAALRDKLKALGLSDDVVRSIVGARINSRYTARFRELLQAATEDAKNRPYWRGSIRGVYSFMSFSPEQQKELRELGREANQESKRILGVNDLTYSFNSLRYPFLSPEKAKQLSDIESDYSDLRMQTMQEMSGFRMPNDSEKLKLLDEEKERDLQAALTPEEREQNNLRNSQTAMSLRHNFAGFDATEDEYKAVYALQSAMDEKYPISMGQGGGADAADFWRARSEAQKEVDAQIQGALGPDRYAEYVRGQRQDYQSLLAAAQRFNLSADTVAQTYQARDAAAGDAKRISDDQSLSAEEKTQAYAMLAEQAQGQIRATLGDEVGNAYINNALPWLKNLSKGGRVMVDSRGNVNLVSPPARARK